MFRNYVIRNFPFLEDDFDALTDYQLFCKICGYVIKYQKDNKEMMTKIEEFQHYFDNLDVQEEINNKLDEMAESGELAEIINEEIFENLNNEVKNNKEFELSDTVQGKLYKNIKSIITAEYSLSSVIITNVNGYVKGIAVMNDWSSGGSGGNKFDIVTFDYENETISNVITRVNLLDGHSNSMCEVGNNKVLICANGYNYIYDLLNNNYSTVTDTLPYFSAVANYEGVIYASQPYDNVFFQPINKLYILSVDNENDTITLEDTKTLPDYNEKIGGNSQGMVIYNGLIIFPSFAPCKLCIYELESLKYLKTQLFTAPYITEIEDGFIYDNKLLLVDTEGNLLIPDIYDKNSIGDYYHSNITKSLTDILLYNTPKLLTYGSDNIFKFNDVMGFNTNNVDTDIGTLGNMLESVTIYLGMATVGGTTIHQLKPFDILCYKSLANSGVKNRQGSDITAFSNKFNADVYFETTGTITSYTFSGVIGIRGGDSVPTIEIYPYTEIVSENYNTDTATIIDATDTAVSLYILKIVGHRKVGSGY